MKRQSKAEVKAELLVEYREALVSNWRGGEDNLAPGQCPEWYIAYRCLREIGVTNGELEAEQDAAYRAVFPETEVAA